MTKHAAAARVMADECLCFRARRASRALTGIYDDALRPLGIQATQLTLLNAIALNGARGGTMGEVADFLAMDATTLSRNVRPLEKSGLVRVERKAADGRVRMAMVTPAGERMIEQALPRWKRAHRQILSALGPEAAADLRAQFDSAALAVSEATSACT
jgi:DNA-binding MarR family transcriptional regulator